MHQQYIEGLFKAGKPEGEGKLINQQPNLVMLMEKCNTAGINLEEWNCFESKIKANKDMLKALSKCE